MSVIDDDDAGVRRSVPGGARRDERRGGRRACAGDDLPEHLRDYVPDGMGTGFKRDDLPAGHGIDLADIIGDVPRDRKICCPFHDDRSPSLHVYTDHYYCFACGANGDRIGWLMQARGMAATSRRGHARAIGTAPRSAARGRRSRGDDAKMRRSRAHRQGAAMVERGRADRGHAGGALPGGRAGDRPRRAARRRLGAGAALSSRLRLRARRLAPVPAWR